MFGGLILACASLSTWIRQYGLAKFIRQSWIMINGHHRCVERDNLPKLDDAFDGHMPQCKPYA